ncbi:S9 family peptidase [Thermus sp. 2.9]|uniref:alpha/beta hydrolase family protein n=1 Tax=Thermus sp. (strain 2.9) TaxID=1577051 RepID=UPI0006898B64|nr:hypothetical protein [Thermus sp. 2.9]
MALLRRSRPEALGRWREVFGGLPEDCPACYVRQSPLPEAGRLQAPLLVLQAGNDPLTPHPGLPPPGRAGGDGAEGVPGGPFSEDHPILFPDLHHAVVPAMGALVERFLLAWLWP